MVRSPSQKKFILINIYIYRPPSGNGQIFFNSLVEHLDQIALSDNMETFVMGDLNIDIGVEESPNVLSFTENLFHLGLSQQITRLTCQSKITHRQRLITYILTLNVSKKLAMLL